MFNSFSGREFHEISLDKGINVAVHHSAHIGSLIISAVILHSPVITLAVLELNL